jgi:hypothetical protein
MITSSLVAKWITIKVITTIIALKGLEVKPHLSVKMAFLNNQIK